MPEQVRFRGRPAVWLLGIGVLALLAIQQAERFFPNLWPHAQARNMVLLGTIAVLLILLLGWWMLFSGLSLRAKMWGLLAVALPASLFRYGGMTGDFLPVFEFRFRKAVKAQAITGPALAGLDAERPDFSQFLGPTRDGKITGVHLDPDWQARPPVVVWRREVGAAWSGFAVVKGRAVTMEESQDQEWVVCRQLTTGEELWRTAIPERFSSSLGGVGPRATPTIVGERVFTFGSTGVLRCLNLTDGKLVWSRDLRQEAQVGVPEWGFSSSPLVHEGKVIVSAGGKDGRSLLAFNAENGTPVWQAGDGVINYSSPFLREIAGRMQVLMFNSDTLSAHDPATGALLWEYGWPSNKPNVAQPIVTGGNQVLISSGYAYGSELIEVQPSGKSFTVDRKWKSSRFQAKFSNPVERDGFVYGVSDGDFACLDLSNGSRKWKGAHYGHGQCLMVGDYFLQVGEEKGDLVLLRPTPGAPNELGRINVFDAKTWNPIALCGDLLLMRNDREVACLKLPLKSAPAGPKE